MVEFNEPLLLAIAQFYCSIDVAAAYVLALSWFKRLASGGAYMVENG